MVYVYIMADSERVTARVKWFNNKNGYGFASTLEKISVTSLFIILHSVLERNNIVIWFRVSMLISTLVLLLNPIPSISGNLLMLPVFKGDRLCVKLAGRCTIVPELIVKRPLRRLRVLRISK